MNLIYRSIAGAIVFCLIVITVTIAQTNTPVFDQLKQKFEERSIFQAAFMHEYRDSYTGEESISQGEIWIGRDKYRVESEDQIIVVDGEISQVYDGIRNRLLISEYVEEEDDFAPSRMLQGVDDTYSVEEEGSSTGPVIKLTSDDIFAIFALVEISLDQNGNPVEIQAVDQVDNLLITRFQEGRFQEEAPDLFEMDVPEDAERIDLRH